MKRELKFRAWRVSEMIYQSESGYHAVAHFFNRVHGQHEVMQFTGLKDKNGKEIYEGDRVHCYLNDQIVGEPDRIEFHFGSFWLMNRDRAMHSWYSLEEGGELMSGDFEVIGNIYQP